MRARRTHSTLLMIFRDTPDERHCAQGTPSHIEVLVLRLLHSFRSGITPQPGIEPGSSA